VFLDIKKINLVVFRALVAIITKNKKTVFILQKTTTIITQNHNPNIRCSQAANTISSYLFFLVEEAGPFIHSKGARTAAAPTPLGPRARL
jgi:hypothetical protein